MALTPAERNLALWGALAALATAGIVVAVRSQGALATAPSAVPAPRPPHDPETWEAEVRAYAEVVEDMTNWPGLADYMVAVAWTESRGNPRACYGKCAPNAARGWLGLVPTSSRIADFPGGSANTLLDPRWTVAIGAWYAARARNWAGPGQHLDWLALRRYWALPRLADDVDETEFVEGWGYGGRSKHSRANFTEGLQKTGQPTSFMYERAFAPDWKWPGSIQDPNSVVPILEALGAPPAYAVA